MGQLRYIVTGTGRSGTVGLASLLTSMGIPCSHERFFNGNSLNEALRLLETGGGENSICSQHCGLPERTDRVEAESSYMAAPFLDAACFAHTNVIHAVRNPWKVILSFLNNIQFFRGEPESEHEQFIYSVLPQLHDINNAVDRAVYYYIHWNRMIETLARKQRRIVPGLVGKVLGIPLLQRLGRKQRLSWYIFHRIEDGSTPLLRKLGLAKHIRADCPKRDDVNAFENWPRELRHDAPTPRITVEHVNASKFARELRRLAKRYGYPTPSFTKAPTESVSDNVSSWGEFDIRFAAVPRMLEEGYRGYNLVRWQTACYALRQGIPIDLETTSEHLLKEKVERGEVAIAECLSQLKAKVDEVSSEFNDHFAPVPRMLEEGYRGYNLVRWQTACYALRQGIPIDLETTSEHLLKEKVERGEVVIAERLSQLKAKVDEVSSARVRAFGKGEPLLAQSGYHCYNLVFWGGEYYALHQQELNCLALEIAAEHVLKEFLARGTLVVAPSLLQVRQKVDHLVHNRYAQPIADGFRSG